MTTKKFVISLFFFIATESSAQTLGGNAVYNFLSQPSSAQVASLGGINISNQSNDVSLGLSNPALLRKGMHQQIATSFNGFLAGISNYSAVASYYQDTKLTGELDCNICTMVILLKQMLLDLS